MRIRKSEVEDSEEITELHKRTVREVNDRDYPEEVIRRWVNNITRENTEKEIEETNFYVAEKQGEIVGFVNFTEEGEIYQVYVDPDHLNQGIGTTLLKKAEEKAREKGIRKMKGYTTLTAQEFFRKKGYKLKGEAEYPLNNVTVKMREMEKELEVEE